MEKRVLCDPITALLSFCLHPVAVFSLPNNENDLRRFDEGQRRGKAASLRSGYFSGQEPYDNDPNCTYRPNSAIPVGRYWIVPRPDGSIASRIRGWGVDTWNSSNHSEWFALFNS